MPAWQIQKLWKENEIDEYRAYIATEGPKQVGSLRSTCEDLAIRMLVNFASANALPVRFENGANPNGLIPENFDDCDAYIDKVLTSTGASDLYKRNTVKMVKGAMVSQSSSLGLAKKGDLIMLYSGPGHVQVVVSGSPGVVEIVQGNFRPESERCGKLDRWWNEKNQNRPTDSCYIGAMVAKRSYRNSNGRWEYESDPSTYKKDGRLVIWDFQAWNNEVTEHIVQQDETLSSLALRYYRNGNEWQRIYRGNRDRIGDNPDRLLQGTHLYIWNN